MGNGAEMVDSAEIDTNQARFRLNGGSVVEITRQAAFKFGYNKCVLVQPTFGCNFFSEGERHAIYSLACPRGHRDGWRGKSRMW